MFEALSALMTKDEFVENLKCHQEQSWTFAKKTSTVAVTVFVILFLSIWLKLFENIADPRMVVGLVLLIYLIFYLIIRHKHEKNIDRENSMHCSSCGKRFDQNSLPIAVLENKCQECGAKIYDT